MMILAVLLLWLVASGLTALLLGALCRGGSTEEPRTGASGWPAR